jgi:hypothetical protein
LIAPDLQATSDSALLQKATFDFARSEGGVRLRPTAEGDVSERSAAEDEDPLALEGQLTLLERQSTTLERESREGLRLNYCCSTTWSPSFRPD